MSDTQEIISIRVGPEMPYCSPEEYRVGQHGVTKIIAYGEGGLHCDIPYIRVIKGDEIHAEFCKHAIVGVYYEMAEGEIL